MAHRIVSVRLQQWIAGLAMGFAVALVLALSASPAWAQATGTSAALPGSSRPIAATWGR